MEFTVLDAQNTPKKPVIAVRVGSALRHAELALNTPFHVPSRGQEDKSVKVSLYEQLGTQTIPDADEPESVCNVPVRAPDGRCTQVKLRIRRGQTNTSLADAKRSQVGVEAYLNTHQLEARLQSLFETVLKKQPQDPYRCMIEELQKARSPGSGEQRTDSTDASAAPVPKAPVAPAEPPPKNARPSPAAKGRNVKPSSESEKPASSKEEADTKAALASFMNSNVSESKSLAGAREQVRSEAVKAMNNSSEMATEIMRHCLRKSITEVTPGERAEIREATRWAILLVVQQAHSRLEARSLGLMSGGRSSTSAAPAPSSAARAEDKGLTNSMKKNLYEKVSSSHDLGS